MLLSSPFFDSLKEERKKKIIKKEDGKSAEALTLLTPDERIFLTEKFNQFLNEHNVFSEGAKHLLWPSFEWILKNYIPSIINLAALCPPNTNALLSLRTLVESISNTFGLTYSQIVLKPQFQAQLGLEKKDFLTDLPKTPQELSNKRKKLLPLFLSILAPTMEDLQFTSFFKEVVEHIANNQDEWSREDHVSSLCVGLQWLCNIDNKAKKKILNLLWELVVDKNLTIRLVCADMFGAMVKEMLANFIRVFFKFLFIFCR